MRSDMCPQVSQPTFSPPYDLFRQCEFKTVLSLCMCLWFGEGLWHTCGMRGLQGILLPQLSTLVAAPMPPQSAILISVVHHFIRRAGPF